MFRAIFLFLLLTFSFNCFSQEIVSYLEVTSSYEDSLLLAENQNKKILVFFTADYCSWCSKQKEVFLDSEVSNILNNYIVCYIDITKRKDISSKYKVRSVPSYFIIDEKENIINKNVGYKVKNDFIKWLQK